MPNLTFGPMVAGHGADPFPGHLREMPKQGGESFLLAFAATEPAPSTQGGAEFEDLPDETEPSEMDEADAVEDDPTEPLDVLEAAAEPWSGSQLGQGDPELSDEAKAVPERAAPSARSPIASLAAAEDAARAHQNGHPISARLEPIHDAHPVDGVPTVARRNLPSTDSGGLSPVSPDRAGPEVMRLSTAGEVVQAVGPNTRVAQHPPNARPEGVQTVPKFDPSAGPIAPVGPTHTKDGLPAAPPDGRYSIDEPETPNAGTPPAARPSSGEGADLFAARAGSLPVRNPDSITSPTPDQIDWRSEATVFSDRSNSTDMFGLGTVSSRPNADVTAFQRPEMPRHVAMQIAEAIQRGGDKGVDLMLNPAELGRVKISLAAADAGMIVSIVAERPETLDLLRRHIDLLAQDFHDLGYDTAEFSFGQNRGDSGADDGASPGPGPIVDAAPEVPPNRPQVTHISTDRVDIRL